MRAKENLTVTYADPTKIYTIKSQLHKMRAPRTHSKSVCVCVCVLQCSTKLLDKALER